jgi:hypothetical protein
MHAALLASLRDIKSGMPPQRASMVLECAMCVTIGAVRAAVEEFANEQSAAHS